MHSASQPRRPIATRNGQPAYLAAPPRKTQTMVEQSREEASAQDASSDLFTLICGILIGAIVGAMLALSFAPTWVML